MLIKGEHYHTIWISEKDKTLIQAFDQRWFPHEVKTFEIRTSDDAAFAIKEMVVRGAPLIGVTAAYGIYLACVLGEDVVEAGNKLKATRPTAINLEWAVNEMLSAIQSAKYPVEVALEKANQIKQDDIAVCKRIGEFGLGLIQQLSEEKKGNTVNILTHCNAGWLATIDWGTALSPIYHAHEKGIDVHIWVDETRPRNQGASLTAFELSEQGIKHTLINDNTGGHLMQHCMVDLVIVGTDRTTRNGDVANKIGTYLKALAANDNNVPFYVALPSSTLDCSIRDGVKEIPIETRDQNEVKYIQGLVDGEIKSVLICPENTTALNYGFDVTPAKFITGLITERGICKASEDGIRKLFPEKF